MGVGVNIVSVVVLLGVLIFVHELGHFLLAKSLGVGVLKFSLGFGPKLIGQEVGETEYMISLVPLGGYVKLLGESDTDDVLPQDEKRSFVKQHVLKKIAIVVAGPFFNFLFAILAFCRHFHGGSSEPHNGDRQRPAGLPGRGGRHAGGGQRPVHRRQERGTLERIWPRSSRRAADGKSR